MKERRENDAYDTPPWAVRTLLRHWTPPLGGVWVEPAVGSGNVVRAMRETCLGVGWRTYDVVERLRIRDSNVWFERKSFFDLREPCPTVSLVMTNPPFSLAREFLEHSCSLYTNAYLMFLLRLGFLASKERAGVWPRFGEPDLYILANRPSYTEDGETDRYDYAWYGFPPVKRVRGTVTHLPDVELEERKRGFW